MTDDTKKDDELKDKVTDEAQNPPISETEVLEQKEDQVAELTNALARAMADLQNFKRRTEEDQSKFVRFASSEMLRMILPVVDNLNRSKSHMPEDLKENEWAKGVIHAHDDLLKNLEKMGVKKMEVVGKKLDPKFHDGVMMGTGERDMVVEELEPGYTLNGEVLKVAKVKVGDGS
jgi:molecular chaperone GrpE